MTDWRLVVTRLNGDGTERVLTRSAPISGVEYTDDYSGPGELSGVVDVQHRSLFEPNGDSFFVPWRTAIYPEANKRIQAGFLVANLKESGATLGLDCVGFTGYFAGQPYEGAYREVGVDALDVARHLVDHLQQFKGANLGMEVGSAKSGRLLGTKKVEGDEESGPYRLTAFEDTDIGAEWDQLAEETPFAYRMEHGWNRLVPGQINHKLQLGYPTLGRRLHKLRFVVGENITILPEIDYFGDWYASEVVVLGAGDGSKRKRGRASRSTDRLRRVVVLEDSNLTSDAQCKRRAQMEVDRRLGLADISEIQVKHSRFARAGSYRVGDEIFIHTDGNWSGRMGIWVQILAIRQAVPSDQATLTVARVEKVS